MDRFSYTIFVKNLQDNPLTLSLDQFEQALLTLSPEDIQDIFDALHYSPKEDNVARHVVAMLQILWHYQ